MPPRRATTRKVDSVSVQSWGNSHIPSVGMENGSRFGKV